MHLLGGEHASTPQSGVEAPRLLKRSLPRLYYCCCWLLRVVACVVSVVVVVAVAVVVGHDLKRDECVCPQTLY